MDGSNLKLQHGRATRAIHAGYEPADADGAISPPVHFSSSFSFASAADARDAFTGDRPAHIYTRISNPTLDLLERRMASLEDAEAALAFASGMGAITSTLWSLVQPGDEIVTDLTLYGSTFAFLHHGLARFGVTISPTDLSVQKGLDVIAARRPRLVYFESPANPNMRLVDITAVSAAAREAGALSVVDSTYATPCLTRPITLGADVVLHSATKYLCGHGDALGGIAAGRRELIDTIRMTGLKDMTGAAMAPFNAMMILRGLKTLDLRMERHSANAEIVARWLSHHPVVAAVAFPGLGDFPQRALAERQMDRPGGMIAFELTGGLDAGSALMDRLMLIRRAVSLGDTDSLIQHPASMTHSTYTPEERARFGIGEGLIRLSVGLEDPADIIADLEQAMPAI
ncbi:MULTISPECIES: aminotransferase class I/II-fold pyridoxal phosphate-dependent enzyme [Hyphobacterium]|uniref:Aminotransferase class I/II-fold pyridoxal phosphate-dependent enzyme n=1 Tax=Hyphobacterium vulgare TaxID=1736751 RepID=A0ABV6ZZI6_9PROT